MKYWILVVGKKSLCLHRLQMKSKLQQSVREMDIQELLTSVDVFPTQFIQASSKTRWLEIRVAILRSTFVVLSTG